MSCALIFEQQTKVHIHGKHAPIENFTQKPLTVDGKIQPLTFLTPLFLSFNVKYSPYCFLCSVMKRIIALLPHTPNAQAVINAIRLTAKLDAATPTITPV